MRDLRDLKNEEGEPGKKKKGQPAWMIGVLGLLVFLALFFFFRRGKTVAPPPLPPVSAPAPGPIAKAPAEGGEEAAVKDPALKPGEMRFEPKKDEINPMIIRTNFSPIFTDFLVFFVKGIRIVIS